MKLLCVRNLTRDRVLAERAWHARTFGQRTRGLLGRPALQPGQGMVIEPCSSVHMWGMSVPLDVVFADAQGTVKHVVADLQPWSMTKVVRGARYAIELPVGALGDTAPGDQLALQDVV